MYNYKVTEEEMMRLYAKAFVEIDERLIGCTKEPVKTVVTNKSKLISDEEINACLSLLNERYLNLNTEIIIYDNPFQAIKSSLKLSLLMNVKELIGIIRKRIVERNIFYYYDTVQIFPFSYEAKDKIDAKFLIIAHLFCKLRELYQEQHMYYIKNERIYKNKLLSFVVRMFDKNHNELKKILNP